MTTNEAEYAGVALALKKAVELGVTHLKIFSDSKLIVNQTRGEWKVKEAHLKPHRALVWELGRAYSKVEIVWVPRSQNKEADALCRKVMRSSSGRSRPGGREGQGVNPFV